MPVFSALTPDRLPELCRFVAAAFGPESCTFEPRMLGWKYFDPHPWWPAGRSYVFETAEGIAAHGCVAPVRYLAGSAAVESMQIVDWAGSGLIPGGGLLLYRRCLELSGGTLLAIGGSDEARRLIPQIKWFTRRGDLRMYARPLRAWRYGKRKSSLPNKFGRAIRNLTWQLFPLLPDNGAWTCRTVPGPNPVFMPSGDYVPILRTPEWIEYLMRCPALRTEFVVLEAHGEARGHALLAAANGSVRIADFVVPQGDRAEALRALIRHIQSDVRAVEVVAGSSLPELWPYFEACGLRLRESVPVFLADPKKLIPADAMIELAPLVGDTYSLYNADYPFLC